MIGIAAVALFPLTFVAVLGYAVSAVRAADGRPSQGPPAWRIRDIYGPGRWIALALFVLTAPFVVLALPLSSALAIPQLWRSQGSLLDVEAWVTAGLILALPWGILLLVLMPHAVARYATSLQARDLFDFASSLRSVRREFATWNLVIAAIVTAWAIGLACTALFCIGIVPGVFYAILVSSHATAALHPESPRSSSG